MRLDALHGNARTPLLEYELEGRHYETELDHSYQLRSCSDSTLTSDA